MSFWSGFARGLSEEMDRSERRREFEETLKQRRLETLMAVRGQREAAGDFDSSSIEGLSTFGATEEDTETPMATEGVVEAEPFEAEVAPAATVSDVPTESDSLVTRPTKVEAPQPEVAPAKAATQKPPKGFDAYAAGLMHMGLTQQQVEEILVKAGKPGVKFAYESFAKGFSGEAFTQAEIQDALKTFVVSVERGGKVDDLKLWQELFPDAGELSEADLSYLEATRTAPPEKVDMLMPYFDTRVKPEKRKPLTVEAKANLRKDLATNLIPAVNAELRKARSEGDVEKVSSLDKARKALEEGEISTAMVFLPVEVGVRVATPYFEQYPELLQDKVFIGNGLEGVAEAYISGNEAVAETSESGVQPGGVKMVDPKEIIATFATREEAQAAINRGEIPKGSTFKVGDVVTYW